MTESGAGKRSGRNPAIGPRRRASRLAAVQTRYQLSLGGGEVEDAIIEFLRDRPGATLEGDAYAEVDGDLFADIVRGSKRRHDEIVALLDRHLPARWRFARLDQILAEILACAAYELQRRPDVPAPVIINEYVEITKAFYDGKEGGFINGVLQEVANGLRADEIEDHKHEQSGSA
ncbi:MAG: transcription antitermination factor NusB [Alphaproteobacteria bacterium]|jgi:N utilization substance protein B|nr:transcription antitermination factor NusB [Alphaproteobacteria bacterium]MDP6815037.1 transcription antitermination factor NusB [Alphaproteobacteria bacterium]